MRRRLPWIGSALLHALIVAALAWLGSRAGAPPATPDALSIQVVDPVPDPDDPGTPYPDRDPDPAPAGGGSAVVAAAEAPARSRPRRARRARSEGPAIGSVETESRGGSGWGGPGSGGGGSGWGVPGSGSGSGSLGAEAPSTVRLPDAPVAPAPPPRSKARPPILIYPKRYRSESEGEVYAAELEIDDEGFVVGVRMTRGVRSRRVDAASTAVWRFRYDPARDDDGAPIAARIEQRFMLD